MGYTCASQSVNHCYMLHAHVHMYMCLTTLKTSVPSIDLHIINFYLIPRLDVLKKKHIDIYAYDAIEFDGDCIALGNVVLCLN